MTRSTSHLCARLRAQGLTLRLALGLALGLAFGGAALAADPMVSVPSTPGSDGKVEIKGMALAPLSNVTVRFAPAQAAPMDVVAQTTANGSFVVRFLPPLTGGYKVSVYDSAGKLIGQGRFGVVR